MVGDEDISPRVFLVILAVSTAVVYLLHYWWKRCYFWEMSAKIPGPTPLPLIGVAHLFLGCNITESTSKLQGFIKKYGKTTKIWIGSRLCVMLTDPEAIENVIGGKTLRERAEVFRFLVKDLFGNGLITNSGDTWRRHTKIISFVFRNDTLDSFVDNFSKNATKLSYKLNDVTSPCIFNIYDYAILCTVDAVHETVLGTSVHAQVKNGFYYGQYITEFLQIVNKRITRPWLLYDFIFRLTDLHKRQESVVNFFYENARRILSEERERHQQKLNGGNANTEHNIRERKSVLEILMEDGELTDQEILDETITMIVAGAETTANTFSFALVLLGEHHNVQDKVLEEQKNIYGDDADRPVSSKDLHKMPYLDQVIKEVLRLFPSISILTRHVLEDTDLGNGYQIPKGADIFVCNYDLHRDPDLFSDPDRFDPDRFAPENCVGRHPYAYNPFGGGRRTCPGMKYSIMELKTLLSVILRRYRIVRAVDGVKEIENNLEYGIALRPSIGFNIQIEPRNTSRKVLY